MLRSGIEEQKHAFADSEVLASDPIISEWREAYRALGVKPSKFRASLEALVRRALADKPLATGIAGVDFYNAHSLNHHACLGAYDGAKLESGTITLRFCNPRQDKFLPLGGNAGDFPLTDRLAVYAIDHEILCWGFNCRDSARTALSEDTEDALFFAEAVTLDQKTRAESALVEKAG